MKNYLDWIAGSGTSHISQIGILHMKHPIHTKFDIKACILTVNAIAKNDRNWFKGSDSSHM